MSKETGQIMSEQAKKRDRSKTANLILTVLPVIFITTIIFVFRERLAGLGSYGYLGAFLISLIGNATVLIPIAVLPVLIAMSVTLYPVTGANGPVMIGLAGGLGAGIGEITGYMVGYSGQGAVEGVRLYNKLVGWVKKWGASAIFVLSVVPFFFDLVGIAAGALRFPLWRFFLACWLGRTVLYGSMTLAAAWGWEAVLRLFS